MSANTLVTQEQVSHASRILNAYINRYGLTGNKEWIMALKAMTFQHGNSAENFDETRTKRVYQETTTGTVSLMGADGQPTGVDYGTTRVQHEQLYTMKQYFGEHGVIERNMAKLNTWIASIDVSESGIRSAAATFKNENLGAIYVQEISASMLTHVIGRVTAGLNAARTDTLYGDPIAGTTGVVIATNNVITGGLDESTPATIIQRAVAAVDQHGNKLKFTTPKIIFADAGVTYTDAIKIFNPSQTVNVNDRQILDLYSAGDVLIVPFDSSNIDLPVSDDYPDGKAQSGVAGDCHVFTGELPYRVMAESVQVRVRILNPDKYGNGGIGLDYIYTTMWFDRNGYFLVTGA